MQVNRNIFHEIVGANTPFAWIQSVYIIPEYRGNGLGKRLMYTAIEHVRNIGLTRILLDVSIHNKRAIELYEDLGFQRCILEEDEESEVIYFQYFIQN